MEREQAILSVPESIFSIADIVRWLHSVGIIVPYARLAMPEVRKLLSRESRPGKAYSGSVLVRIAELVSKENFCYWMDLRQELIARAPYGVVPVIRPRGYSSRGAVTYERDLGLVTKNVASTMLWLATERLGGYERILRLEGVVYATLHRDEAELWDLSMCQRRTRVYLYEAPIVVNGENETGMVRNRGFSTPAAVLKVGRDDLSIVKVVDDLICPGVPASLVFDVNSREGWRIAKRACENEGVGGPLVMVRWTCASAVQPVTLDIAPVSKIKRAEIMNKLAVVSSAKEVAYRAPHETPP